MFCDDLFQLQRLDYNWYEYWPMNCHRLHCNPYQCHCLVVMVSVAFVAIVRYHLYLNLQWIFISSMWAIRLLSFVSIKKKSYLSIGRYWNRDQRNDDQQRPVVSLLTNLKSILHYSVAGLRHKLKENSESLWLMHSFGYTKKGTNKQKVVHTVTVCVCV